MRKGVTALLILALVAVIAVAPATAGKKKSGSFSAENPVPHPAPDGCLGGSDDLSKTTEALKAPFSGVLTVTMSEFVGDWDLFLTDADGEHIVSATESQLQGAPPQEEVTIYLPKGFSVQMVACNWAGGPSAEAAWTLVAGKP